MISTTPSVAKARPTGRSWRRLPLYVGGFMGPFGTMVIVPMYPELRESFDVSNEAVTLGFTLYMLPFAALLLVSGTIGERLGRRRTVRVTLAAYAGASLVVAAAPNLGVFLLGRALQGAANAFISPLLLASLADLTPEARLGRAVGIYASFQAAGGALAPLVGGFAADTDWQLAFLLTAIIAGFLAIVPLPQDPVRPAGSWPSLRPLLTRRMGFLSMASFFAAAGPLGAAVLLGVKLRDQIGLSGTDAGYLIAAGGAMAALVGPTWGRLLDRWGVRLASTVAFVLVSTVVAMLGFTDEALGSLFVWLAAGVGAAFVLVVLQSAAAAAVPSNRGGALSGTLSFRFAGHAVGPIVWVPLFATMPTGVFVGSGLLGLVALAAMLAATRSDPGQPAVA